MDPYGHLVEQHVREAELHLRHVDELFDHARQASPRDPTVERLDGERRVLKEALEVLRQGPVGTGSAAARPDAAGLPARMRWLGVELERVLTAIGDRRGL